MFFDCMNRKYWLIAGLFITVHVAFAANTPPIANGATAYWGACTATSNPSSNYTFTAAAGDGTVAGLDLRLGRTESQPGSLWVYEDEIAKLIGNLGANEDAAVVVYCDI
jgi:hypothetical protein